MSAPAVTELLAVLERRGVRLRAEGEHLSYEAPAGALREAEREALRANKAAVVSLLRERQARAVPGVGWSHVSLYQLDRILEVSVPWSDVPLILAPGCRIARELRFRDSKPGRIWCCCEVLDLLLSGVRPEDAKATAQAKVLFNGAVVGARQERRQ